MPSIISRITGSLDGTTRPTAGSLLTPQANTSSVWALTGAGNTSLVDLGEINLGELVALAKVAAPNSTGLLTSTAARAVYVQYSGVATEFSVTVALRTSNSTLVMVGPTRTIDPTAVSPDTVLELALPSLDHSLIVSSNAAPSTQTIAVYLQDVPPTTTNFTADFSSNASSPAAGDEPFSTDTATASVDIPIGTIQRYSAAGGAFGVNSPGVDTPNGRFGVKEVGGTATALTITATAGATIEDLDGVVGATAVITQADVCVMWQLDPNVGGANPIWRVVWTGPGQESVLLTPAADAAVALTRVTGGVQLTVTGAGTVAISTTSSFAGQKINLFAIAVAGGGSYTLALDVGTLTINAASEGATVMRNAANSAWVCVGLSGATIV